VAAVAWCRRHRRHDRLYGGADDDAEESVSGESTATPGSSAPPVEERTLPDDVGGWPMVGADAANTGTAPESGPKAGVTAYWQFEADDRIATDPAVVDGTVYVGSHDDHVYALDATDGSELWAADHGIEETAPAVVDGTVYLATHPGVIALSATDGTQRWSAELSGAELSAPSVVGGTVYLGLWDDNVYALDAADGTEQWRFDTGDDLPGSPAVADGTVFIATEGGTLSSHRPR